MFDGVTLFRTSILGSAFILSIVGILVYRILAIRFNIIAERNQRTLHNNDTPKGSGIIFSLVSIFLTYLIWFQGLIPDDLTIVICFGGFAATLFGFVDDIINIPAKIKLFIQILLSGFIILCFGEVPLLLDTEYTSIDTGIVGVFIGVIALVWLINLCNFMDGTDGMAASGTIFICAVIAVILFFIQDETEIGLVAGVLALSCFAFLLFNWPMAKIFMGDAGSVFIGYVFGVFIIYTMMLGYISIWTWIIVFGYFGIDTTLTLILRLIHIKKWYGAHRSHAYQNLARIWDSHSKILYLVICFHLLWLLPLAILSVAYNQYQELVCLLAISPTILWTLKYGPYLSND